MNFVHLIHKLSSKINSLDYFNYFAYVPAFYINKKNSYNSDISALVFLGYIIFFLYIIIVQTINHFANLDQVISTKDILTYATNYTLTTKDFLFGVGLIYGNNTNVDIYNLPGIVIQFRSIFTDINLQKNYTYFNSTPCNATMFFSKKDWNEKDDEKKKLLYGFVEENYLCPDSNFSALMTPRNWNSLVGSFEVIIKINNLSILNSTLSLIQNPGIKAELIYGSTPLKIDDKYEPFETIIDSSIGNFRKYFIQTTEITLVPVKVYDDKGIFDDNYIVYKGDKNANQEDGSSFIKAEEKVSIEDIYDRSIPVDDNLNLVLMKYVFSLSNQTREVYRNYRKFLEFLAGISALTSIVLIILMVFMQAVNVILAKHLLFKVLFNSVTLKNITKFEKDFSKQLEELQINFSKKKNFIKNTESNINNFVRNETYNNSTIKQNYDILPKISLMNVKDDMERKKLVTIIESNTYKEIQTEKVNDVNNRCAKTNSNNDIIKLNHESLKKTDSVAQSLAHKNEKKWIFDFSPLEGQYFEYDFFFCCYAIFRKDRVSQIYYNAEEHLSKFLDIKTLFTKYQELEMLKELLFEKSQKNVFEVLSKLNNIRNFFSEMEEDNEMFIHNRRETYNSLYDSLKEMNLRGNKFDLRLLDFFKSIFIV